MTMTFHSHEQYFASVSPEARVLLEQIQAEVQSQIPTAIPCIGYSMPAFKHKKIFFYFAAFKKHIGVYPPLNDDQKLISKLEKYRGAKGNLTFLYEDPLPLKLIGKVAVALAKQYE